MARSCANATQPANDSVASSKFQLVDLTNLPLRPPIQARRRDEDLEHVSVWGKYLKPTDFGSISFTLSGYEGDWHPTEQVPERAIGSSTVV